jgi:hypothetical protein
MLPTNVAALFDRLGSFFGTPLVIVMVYPSRIPAKSNGLWVGFGSAGNNGGLRRRSRSVVTSLHTSAKNLRFFDGETRTTECL